MIKVLGQSPISSAATAGRNEFMSIFRSRPSNAYGEDPNAYPRPYVSTRGILIRKELVEGVGTPDLKQGYQFQFNPQTITDVKNTLYETRQYAGLPYNDYIWGGGGERVISFQLFLDNTPQSKQRSFRPTSYGSKLAKEFKSGGVVTSKSPASFEYVDNGAYSTSRVDERGILPEVELIQSFLYPAPLTGESTPLFAEGGIVSLNQFRPPATVVLAIGPLYLEGVVKSAPVTYSLFDQDLTPIRGTVDIEFAVFEFENVERQIDRRTY